MERREFMSQSLAVGAVAATGSAWSEAPSPRSTADGAVQDKLVINGMDPSNISEEYVEIHRRTGVHVWHWSRSFTDVRAFADTYNFIDRHSDKIQPVRSVTDMMAAKEAGKLGLLFGWQAANVISNGRGGPNDYWSDETKTELRAYYELGLRTCGIAYQIANVFGGGALDGHMGLSRAGRTLVEEIHKLNIILDVGGHTGDQTSLDALEISEGVPVICSHANPRALANSSRAIPDPIIEAIAATGGVVGVVAINDYVVRGEEMAHLDVSPLGDVDDFLEHAEYIRDLVGIDHVGLGPDFTHGRPVRRNRALFGPAAQDTGPRRYVKGFEDIGDLPNVLSALERRGWPQDHIDKFLADNWLRVYRQVWGE